MTPKLKLKSDGKITFPKVSKMSDKELMYALILKSEMASTEELRKFLENCEWERLKRNAVKKPVINKVKQNERYRET